MRIPMTLNKKKKEAIFLRGLVGRLQVSPGN